MREGLAPESSVEAVIITEAIRNRPHRGTTKAAEHDAFSVLSNALLSGPERLLELLAESARRLCHAQSAGISVEDLTVDPPVFRWHAVAGRLAPFVNGTMPRYFSPCGETLARGHPLLMARPDRHFVYLQQLQIPLHEVLLVPFAVEGKLIGTVWILAHDEVVQFCPDDIRIVQGLTDYAGMAVAALKRSASHLRTGRSEPTVT